MHRFNQLFSMNTLWEVIIICLAVLAPVKMTMLAVFILILSDLATGVWAAWKRKEPITSAALRRTLSKILIYELCVICAFFVEKFILDGDIPVIKIVAGVIGLTELKSILENASSITGVNIFKEAIKRLGSPNDHK